MLRSPLEPYGLEVKEGAVVLHEETPARSGLTATELAVFSLEARENPS